MVPPPPQANVIPSPFVAKIKMSILISHNTKYDWSSMGHAPYSCFLVMCQRWEFYWIIDLGLDKELTKALDIPRIPEMDIYI